MKIVIVLLVISCGLFTYMILDKPKEIIFDNKESQKYIKSLEQENEELRNENDLLFQKINILRDQKPIIIKKYNEKFDIINSADASKLDSIIRSNW